DPAAHVFSGELPVEVAFDITVTNEGQHPAYRVAVQDRPGDDMEIVTAPTPANLATQTPESVPFGNTRTVSYDGGDEWTINILLPGESVTFEVLVDVTTDTDSPYWNVAEIVDFDDDTNESNTPPAY